MGSIKHISIIGSGNVATHLGQALHAKGLTIDTVWSRKLKRAKQLAAKIDAQPCSRLKQLTTTSDLFIIAIVDDAIRDMAIKLEKYISADAIVVHTSGSVNLTAIASSKAGVFYPLQSFSIDRKVDIKKVPFCVNASNDRVEKLLLTLARKLSKNVYRINDEQRAVLHLAAVFSSNFSNHMYHLASNISVQNGVDFNILKPLILETAAKIVNKSPYDMQTGPARRDDQETINRHLKQLKSDKISKEIYKLITKSISSQYQ